VTVGKRVAAIVLGRTVAAPGVIRRSRVRVVIIAVASAALFSTGGLMVGPANAAGNTTVPTSVATGSVSDGAGGGGGSRTAVPAADAVDCYTHMPDPSLNGDGDVILAAAVSCTRPMRLLEATLDLDWNGIQVEQDIRSGSTAVGVGVSSPCMPGSYSGKLTLDLIWPVGVNGSPTYTEYTRNFVTEC
jgi:hypothetical protein